MTTITDKLNQLADLRAEADLLRADYEAKKQEIIPPEVRDRLIDLDAEITPSIWAAEMAAEILEKDIIADVIAHGATVKGADLQAVYTKARVSWDTKALDGYAAGHPEVLPFRKEGKPSVSIRGVK